MKVPGTIYVKRPATKEIQSGLRGKCRVGAPDNMNETSGGVAGRNTLGAFRCREEREPAGFASFHQPAPLGVDEQFCESIGVGDQTRST